MLDEKYYDGYHGEDEVRLWVEDKGEKHGLSIWCGFFDTIMEGCFRPYPAPNGIIWCWQHCEGFHDEKWEVSDPLLLLRELSMFDSHRLEPNRQILAEKSEEVCRQMVSFISEAAKEGRKIYIECI